MDLQNVNVTLSGGYVRSVYSFPAVGTQITGSSVIVYCNVTLSNGLQIDDSNVSFYV